MPQVLADRVTAYLREQHPYSTAKQIASRAGISAKTVSKWLEGASAPSFWHLSLLGIAYGLDFMAVAFPETPGLAKAARQERLAAHIAEHERLIREYQRIGQ